MAKTVSVAVLLLVMALTPERSLAYEWSSNTTVTLGSMCMLTIRDYGVPDVTAAEVCGCALQKTRAVVPDRAAYSDAKGASPVFVDNMVKCVNALAARTRR